MTHSSVVAWSYLIFVGGITVVILGIVAAIHGARTAQSPEDLLLKKRMDALETLKRAGEISREQYNQRRTRLLVERYKRHAS